MNVTTTSQTGTLDLKDFLKGLLIAVLSPVFTVLITSLQAGELTFNWEAIGVVALISALTYISKNLFTPAQIVIEAPKPVVDSVKEGDATARIVTVKPSANDISRGA